MIVNKFFEEDEFYPEFWMKWLFTRNFGERLRLRSPRTPQRPQRNLRRRKARHRCLSRASRQNLRDLCV